MRNHPFLRFLREHQLGMPVSVLICAICGAYIMWGSAYPNPISNNLVIGGAIVFGSVPLLVRAISRSN